MKSNTITFFNKSIYKVFECPLCKSKKRKTLGLYQKNLYSEMLSKILKINESKLINKIKNVKCKNCSLVYKNFWFKDKILSNLFKSRILIHPKGNDIFENKFNKNFFSSEIKKLENKTNSESIRKTKRILISILDSVRSKNIKIIKGIKILKSEKKFSSNDFVRLLSLKKFITKPKRFSRFIGYKDKKLWNFLERKIKILSYAETGCPAWGLLEMARRNKVKTKFVISKDKNFWNERKGCLIKSKLNKRILVNDLKYLNKVSLFGIIEYFDHLNDPLRFIKNVSTKSENFYLILDDLEDGKVPIQHFTGWGKKSIKFLSFKLTRKVYIYQNYFTHKKMIFAIFKDL